MRVCFLFAVGIALVACHKAKPQAEPPSSCVISHDGGVTQCFEDIGAQAKRDGEKACNEMHGDHAFKVAEGCPTNARVGACRKRAGTELERVERCYHDQAQCEARCTKSAGVFSVGD